METKIKIPKHMKKSNFKNTEEEEPKYNIFFLRQRESTSEKAEREEGEGVWSLKWGSRSPDAELKFTNCEIVT